MTLADEPSPEWQNAVTQGLNERRLGQGCLVYGLITCVIGIANVARGRDPVATPLIPAAGFVLATGIYLGAATLVMRFLAQRKSHYALIALGLLAGQWALVSYLSEAWLSRLGGGLGDIMLGAGLIWLGACSAQKWVRWS